MMPPSRRMRLHPALAGASMGPGTAKRSRPCSSAVLPVISAPPRLHHHGTHRQASHDAVSHREIPADRLCPRRILRQQCPSRGHILVEIAVLRRVHHVQAAAQHADGHASAPEGPPRRGGVHTPGQTADYHGSAPGQAIAQLLTTGLAVGRTSPGAHHRDNGLLVHRRQVSPHIQQERRIVDISQPVGILRVLKRQDAQPQPAAVLENFLGGGQAFLLQRLRLLPGDALRQ